ncbi:MAG: hypothetical protein JNK51_01290 [Blastocatellia bacterium]|nr:hypothetical protein [Chloracidobacterium sp.]MBL8183530.1 hypothetical protein [Blastocatellia bacterium]HRJ88192.1 hypothetical protein [Pyrinomonadaceae bacterium]HRK49258.1 hypothetical protein [Pyrinomonadaceae bacterium]
MQTRVFSFFAAILLLSNLVLVSTANPTVRSVKRAKTNQLVSMLPASDGIVTLDVKRFFGEALPIVLAAKPTMLNEILAKVAAMQERTGIDVRQFEFIVAGIAANKVGDKHDVDPVMIARGGVNSATIIAAAKTAADNKFKEESVSGKTMYTFAAKEIAAKIADNAGNAKNEKATDKFYGKLSSDLAIAAIDANTIVFGGATRVRQTLEGRSKPSAEITTLLNRKEFSVVNFAAKIPSGMSVFLPLENDELGKSVDSIQYAFGNMDIVAEQALFSMTAKTAQSSQAQELHDTLQVLQSLGKMALGSSKRPDQQLYARLIEKVKFGRSGSEVSLDLEIPKADMDMLMGILIK